MAIINVSRDVSLTTEYLNLPVTHGISTNGYWFHYIPANGSNSALGGKIVPYQWDTPLYLLNNAANLTMTGTVPLVEESWEGSTKKYHGSSIEWIGAGINNITATQESDAFFFGHLGTLNTSPADDAFYWDRAYLDINGAEWNYYQYHKHLPTTYPTYENGRMTLSANGYIVPADKSFGYMIQTRAKVGSTTYSSVTARVHTPSIGGAHNSHNDVNLPATAGFNYMMGGILKGNSERFHAMYIRANGSDWNVYIRTYTDAAKSFGVEANIGTFNLADPEFDPSTNAQNRYPVRLSCGSVLDTRFYFPVILNNATSGYDLEIWSLLSADNVAGGSLIRYVVLSGVSVRPDCMLTPVGDKLYAAVSNISSGGVKLFSFTTSSGSWTDEGTIVTNSSSNHVRIHGFKYSPVDVKFYTLLSGTTSSSGTYLGPGLYSFELSGAFSGYAHLDYVNTDNSFVVKDALSSGYIQYNHVDGTLTKYSTTEPQGIATGTSVLQYDNANPKFFNKTEYAHTGDVFYFQGIQLEDGRKCFVGQIENNPPNLGLPNSGDLLLTIVSDDNGDVHHFAWGGDGDDYITGIVEDSSANKLWVTGYTKSELVPKKDIKIHGWCRNLSDGFNNMAWADLTTDALGNIYVVGSHVENEYIIAAKYDYNYVLQWQKIIDTGSNPDVAYGVAVDDAANVYIVGKTSNGTVSGTDGILVKLDGDGNGVFTKLFGAGNNEYISSIAVIKKNSIEFLVMTVISGTATIFIVTTTNGVVIEQNYSDNLHVNRLRKVASSLTSGKFLFAGNDGAGVSKIAKFGLGEVDNVGRMVRWISTYSDGVNSSDAFDIVNIDAPVSGLGAGYVVVGNDGTQSYVLKITTDEVAGVYTINQTWANNFNSEGGAFMSVTTTPYTATEKYIYTVGYHTMTMGMMTHTVSNIVAWDSSGALQWQNSYSMGEHMNEKFLTCVNDVNNENVVITGFTENHHTSGTEGLVLRLSMQGFGTGAYHLAENSSITYQYQAISKTYSSSTTTITTPVAPNDVTGTLSSPAGGTLSLTDGPFSQYTYDGSYGPNGVFTFFLAAIDLSAVQNYFNSEQHQQTILDASLNKGHEEYYADNIFTFYQVGTVGDGTADDGNIFGYDIIKHSNGKIYCMGQTSGNVAHTNTGASGVYDYILLEFDPATETFEYYQNGTSLDEETYALCELSNGDIAFTGRTSGTLGGPLVGNYDIFLGIFNPTTETFSYYNTGSGLDDKGVGIHDLGNDELIISYSSYGTISGSTNYGSEDIGAIKFNYNTNTWGSTYQTGSSTSELFNQNGSPSCLLNGGATLVIVANSAGIFADNEQTFGYLDIVVGVLDLTTGTWKKYSVGSGASDISTSVYPMGGKVLISGYTEASFMDASRGFFTEFDVLPGLGAKSSTPEV